MATQTITTIGTLSLLNEGWFVVGAGCAYLGADGNWIITPEQGGNFPQGQTRVVHPGELGVPEGATVSLRAHASTGETHQATEEFTFESSSTQQANYTITGTTKDLHLHYQGITNTSEAPTAAAAHP